MDIKQGGLEAQYDTEAEAYLLIYFPARTNNPWPTFRHLPL